MKYHLYPFPSFYPNSYDNEGIFCATKKCCGIVSTTGVVMEVGSTPCPEI